MSWWFFAAVLVGLPLGVAFGAALYAHARACLDELRAERPDWWDL